MKLFEIQTDFGTCARSPVVRSSDATHKFNELAEVGICVDLRGQGRIGMSKGEGGTL
jgi:hypothetical protein